MNIIEIITQIFDNNNIIGAISSSVLIIFLGFILTKKGIFNKATSKILSTVVLSVAIPALAYKAFMSDINHEQLKQGINILIFGFIIYILLIFITKLFYFKATGNKKEVFSVLTTFGSTTFFGLPIIGAVYGAEGVMYGSIFNISYRVFLYTYAYIKLCDIKFSVANLKKMLLNPIIIATFLGIFVWIFQDYLPQVSVTVGESTKEYAFLRIDQTAVWLFSPMSRLAALCSPLAWLAIGAKLADIPFKQAIKSTESWYYSLLKVVAVPVINIILILLLSITGILPLGFTSVAAVVIMMATPTATVAAAYAIGSDKEAVLTSNCSLLSTIVSVILMPFWIFVLEMINVLNILG